MSKDILILGGGGREHAIAHSLRQSKQVGKIYAMPGNGGIASIPNCECVAVKPLETEKILDFLRAHSVYLTIVSTDDALALGTVDTLNKNGFRAFGPTKAAAQIEWSKAYSKDFMQRHGIPCAKAEVFSSELSAFGYIEEMDTPIVVKADGLALGKGVIICNTKAEAKQAVSQMLGGKFGISGNKVLVEEFVNGFEATILAFSDGETIKPMATSRDYKRAFDADKGPNTGGMGTISPMNRFEPYLKRAMHEVFEPTIKGLKQDGRPFKGVIYFDIMVDESKNPAVFNVIEYNARFGDPEAQVVLPRLNTDLLTVLDAVVDGKLNQIELEWDLSPRVCVIAASGGYPESYQTGKAIKIGNLQKDTLVFHAGTSVSADGSLFTSGGRVLGVVGKGRTVSEAAQNAYADIKKITFDEMFYRNDIAKGE